MKKMKKENLIILTPFLLILLNILLKISYITYTSIGGDEPFSIYHALMEPNSIIQLLSKGNNPPFYELFLHYWIKLFGISEFSVRFPSLIFSSLAVYFIYNIGKEFFNYNIALTTCLLYTFSNYHILFAHEARVYALFALLTSISMYFYFKIISKSNCIKHYSYLLISNITLIYSHYFSFFILFIQCIGLLVDKNKRTVHLKKYVFHLFILFILYIPNIYTLLIRFYESSSKGTWLNPPKGVESLYNMVWTFSNAPVVTVISLLIILIALFHTLFKKSYKQSSFVTNTIIIWFIFPFFSMFILSFWIPMFLDRYLIFVSLAYYFVLAISANYFLKNTRLKYILPVLISLLFLSSFNPNMDNKRHVKEVVAKIMELKSDESLVVISPENFILNFAYYYDKGIFTNYNSSSIYKNIQTQLNTKNIYAVNSIEDVNTNNYNHIIYLDAAADFNEPKNNILIKLSESYNLNNTYEFYEIFSVFEYSK